MNPDQQSVRLQQVSEMYHHAMSQMLLHDLQDPNLRGAQITQVVFTPYLKLAKIYFYIAGGENEADRVLKGFIRSKNFIRRGLSQTVQLKFAPDIKFYYDNTFDEKNRIDQLFHKLESQKNESQTD